MSPLGINEVMYAIYGVASLAGLVLWAVRRTIGGHIIKVTLSIITLHLIVLIVEASRDRTQSSNEKRVQSNGNPDNPKP